MIMIVTSIEASVLPEVRSAGLSRMIAASSPPPPSPLALLRSARAPTNRSILGSAGFPGRLLGMPVVLLLRGVLSFSMKSWVWV